MSTESTLPQPPQDGRHWFSSGFVRITEAAFVAPGVVHDVKQGWGRLSPDGLWFSWDSGYDPSRELAYSYQISTAK